MLLRKEVDLKRLSVRVFTANNHYLSHLQHIIMKVGPLRAYSCRNLERTIKKYSNLIKSKTRINANAQNILSSQAGYNSHFVRTITESLTAKSKYSSSTFWCHPSGIEHYPQLWEPFVQDTLLSDLSDCIPHCNITKHKVIKALKSFYSRTRGIREVVLDSLEIGIAAKAWKDSRLYSSVYDRKVKNLHTRAGNIVIFEVNTTRR